MIAATLLWSTLEIVVVAALWQVASWAFGDLVMEHVGVPFVDSFRLRRVGQTGDRP